MNSDTDIFTKIADKYYTFTTSEKKISDYVIIQRKNVQYMSISELAEACGVAEATISRFCRSLGYKGYNAFKVAIASASDGERTITDIDQNSTVYEIARNRCAVNIAVIEQTLAVLDNEILKEAAKALVKAKRIVCMGQGGSLILAMEAAHLFSMAFSNCSAVSDSHLQMIAAAGLGPQDCVVYFSYSGSTKDLEDIFSVIKEQQAKIILITRFPKSSGALQADYVLCCGAKESPLQHGSVEARISQLLIIDILYHEMCALEPESTAEHKKSVAKAVALKHI